MASRFWVGGTGTWDTSATTHWSATTGGSSGASAPTAADDVFIDASSGGGTITLGTTANCRSLDCTGAPATTIAWNNSTWNVGDASGGAFKLVANITVTLAGATRRLNFVSTSSNGGTGWAITSAGKLISDDVIFNGVGGKWVMQDAFSVGTGGLITVTNGTLDTNAQTVTANAISSSNSNVRTLAIAGSTFNLSGTTNAWTTSTATNLTVTGGSTATLNITGAGGIFNASGTYTIGTLNLTGSGNQRISIGSTGVITINTLNRTGTAVVTDSLQIDIGVGTLTIATALTLAGNSAINRLLVSTGTVGTAKTVTCNGTITASYVDFMDITGAGSASWNLSTITGGSGDGGGNTGITFTTPATQTHTASAGGNWSDVTKWTSRIPLAQDNVIVNVNTTGTLTADMPRLGANLTFTGFAGTLTMAVSGGGNFTYGNVILASGMAFSGSGALSHHGRGIHTLTSAGKTVPWQVVFRCPGGSYTLTDDLVTTSTSGWVLANGTFDAAGFNVTAFQYSISGSLARTLNMGSGTWTITGTTAITVWLASATLLTINASTSTIVISTVSTLTRTFAGGGFTYGTLTYTVANSPGSLIITGNNRFATLNIGSGRILSPTSASNNTFETFNVVGVNNGYLYLPGVSAGHYISTPDTAALSITGDLDLRFHGALDSWNTASGQTLVAKTGGAGNRGYFLDTLSGALRLIWSVDGTAQIIRTSSAHGLTAGQLKWVRATLDVDDGAGNNVVKFWTSTDGSSWTQLGATQTNAGVTSNIDSNNVLAVGSATDGTTNLITGKVYHAQVRNNVLDDGTGIQFNADFTAKAFGSNSFTESSANAATVSITGALAQVGDGRVSLVGTVPGTPAILIKTGAWQVGTHSTNVSGNSGIDFAAAGSNDYLSVQDIQGRKKTDGNFLSLMAA